MNPTTVTSVQQWPRQGGADLVQRHAVEAELGLLKQGKQLMLRAEDPRGTAEGALHWYELPGQPLKGADEGGGLAG